MAHWAEWYLERPWVIGARGPDAFDCWGLIYWIYKHQYDIELPAYPGVDAKNLSLVTKMITAGAEGSDWTQVDKPVEGCVVAMSKNTRRLHHVGLYLAIDKGCILHATDLGKVIAQPIQDLTRWGWRRVEFYTHKGMTCQL